jgi:hypothetical protein
MISVMKRGPETLRLLIITMESVGREPPAIEVDVGGKTPPDALKL